jgi:proliferating cell nuclear antigen
MRLYLKTVQSNAFKTLFEVLKEILHDVNVYFDATGMKVMTVDGPRVALIHLRLDASKFEEYTCPQPIHVGINMSNIYKLLKMASNMDTIVLEISEQSSAILTIRIENQEKRTHTVFHLKLLDVDVQELKLPDIEFDSVITMPSVYFQRMCKDMNNVADVLTIESSKEGLTLSCKGDFASQETHIQDAPAGQDGMTFTSRSEETFRGSYMLKYLILFNKAANLSNTMEMYLRKDFPLILKYNVANLGDLRFCLAPKVEEDA